jgi:hypothetical protein
MGPISRSGISQDQLINFPGSSYHDPILSWQNPVAITAIEPRLGHTFFLC